MDLQATLTFDNTYKAYKEVVNADEISADKKIVVEPIYKYRQIVSMGGSRSSKSYSILQLLLLEMMTRKRIKITVWRNMKNVCRTSVMEDFQNIIMFDYSVYKDITHNKQAGSFVYRPTGSRIVFEGADNIGKVLGGTQHISFFNEVSEFSERIYLEIAQRTSDRIFCDYNPSKNFWLEKQRNDPRSVFLHSTFLDNAFCPPNIAEHILGYEPWVPHSYEIRGMDLFYNGMPITPGNQPPPNLKNIESGKADEYMWKVYGLGIGAEKPNKIYRGWRKIDEQTFEALDQPSYFGLDFGASNPTACIEAKYDGDGAFYIRERLYRPLQDIETSLPSVINVLIPDLQKGRDIICCDSAKGLYINQLQQDGYMAIGAVKGNGSVEVGITLCQGFTIYYVPSANLDFEYDNYSWQIDRYEKSTDVPVKSDDHLMDAMRYILTYLVNYLDIKL